MDRYDWPLLAVFLLIALSTFIALRGFRFAAHALTGCVTRKKKRLRLPAFSFRRYQVPGIQRTRVSR